MPITQILYNLLLMPLQMLFEAVYNIAYSFIGNPGITIIVLSLTINLLVLPLYRRADALQEEERSIEMRLSKGVHHIKKAFRGDEQMMMLQTYYRQNGYKPTYALRGATSLLLEIPFFIAAYRFLSNLSLLQGAAFGPIADLGKPDGLIMAAGISINALPFIMTAINLISSYLFTKGYPVKSKIQLYGMALFFLIFLYRSPAGLVFYWTLNNAFSLVKTVFYKLREPKKALGVLMLAAGAGVFALGLTLGAKKSLKWELFLCMTGVLLAAFVLLSLLQQKKKVIKLKNREYTANPKIFAAGAVFMAALTGLIIPSAVIAASPQEFIVPGILNNPLIYIASSVCISVGTFVIWFGVFYSLADMRGRHYIEQAVWVLCGVAVTNYMLFGKNLGLISEVLQYDNGMRFTYGQQLLNMAVIFMVMLVMLLIYRLTEKRVFDILMVAVFALCGLAAVNIVQIGKTVSETNIEAAAETKALHTLSKNGKNVVVIMLDRGMGEYIPYIMNEKPELKERFDGFTYYANTISFGICTAIGSPALFGGYEYTPLEINKRDDEPLVSKHNEALKLMPAIFSENGYTVTVCQPPLAGYQWSPDLSIYDDYPDIKTYNTIGMYSSEENTRRIVEGNKRNFFAFGITKTAPLFMQTKLYEGGRYNCAAQVGTMYGMTQIITSNYKANGYVERFLKNYNVMSALPQITDIEDNDKNTFMMMSNEITHAPSMLQLPNYTPEEVVDNTAYAYQMANGYTVNNRTLRLETQDQIVHYHINMAAMLKLGEWFDYLRQNDVYDNTRIIIVADHGWGAGQIREAVFNVGDKEALDSESFRPLLMVKDFDAAEFTVSDEFMTNADTPTLAFNNLIDEPKNPFTGKTVNNQDKTAHEQYILSGGWELSGNVLKAGDWYAVHGDTWDADNWKQMAKEATSPY